ncbi:MAG: hypothetical protein AAB401_01170, partial [Acidobacteriota bacterium]
MAASFGANMANTTLAASTSLLPTSLGGASVAVLDFKGIERLSPLFFVSPFQINYQIPAGTAPGPALLKFINGVQTVTGSTIVAPSAISIFTTNASGSGPAAALDAFT